MLLVDWSLAESVDVGDSFAARSCFCYSRSLSLDALLRVRHGFMVRVQNSGILGISLIGVVVNLSRHLYIVIKRLDNFKFFVVGRNRFVAFFKETFAAQFFDGLIIINCFPIDGSADGISLHCHVKSVTGSMVRSALRRHNVGHCALFKIGYSGSNKIIIRTNRGVPVMQ